MTPRITALAIHSPKFSVQMMHIVFSLNRPRLHSYCYPCCQRQEETVKKYAESKRETYHRGPRGGATSKAVNPLMHWAATPSPTSRTY